MAAPSPSHPDAGALLRLLQITDSSFPVGGFAFSHGLEWLTQRRIVVDEAGLARFLEAYVDQGAGRQSMPGAVRGYRARSMGALRRADEALDASYAAEGERNAGRAMGERLLVSATDAFAAGALSTEFRRLVRAGSTPGQYAVAYGAIAAEQGIEEAAMLTALGFSMVLAVTQAAVRLNTIGQGAAVRLAAGAAPAIERAVVRVHAEGPRPAIGAFTPNLDAAALGHPSLTFRMFAS
ncbi:MAG: urease accessory protein UreF [Dehalococcoidia bacterium]